MKKNIRKNEKGITLVALVVTIVVLLILAGISLNLVLGQNGIVNKAKRAAIDTDIAETKEQIKLEIMGNFDEEKIGYTNQDVITAVEKITGKKVDENAQTVKSKKGNDVDISDLWVAEEKIKFKIAYTFDGKDTVTKGFTAKDGQTWYEWFGNGDESRIEEIAKEFGNLSIGEIMAFQYVLREIRR